MPDDDVLFGARILLRAPQVGDAAVLFASVTSDPKVTEYLRWAPHPDVDETWATTTPGWSCCVIPAR
jgi:RimJ/RimL family protein N-acetyltransferase